MDIFPMPFVLAGGSHDRASGKACVMNIISYENGDIEITDMPDCSDKFLSKLCQIVNDKMANDEGLILPPLSFDILKLGHSTVGTSCHSFDYITLHQFYIDILKELATNKSPFHWMKNIDLEAAQRYIDYNKLYNQCYLESRIYNKIKNALNWYLDDVVVSNLIDTAQKIIDRFKELTGINSPEPDLNKTASVYCDLVKV